MAPSNDALGGCAEWNIPGWSRDHYRAPLTNNPVTDSVVMQELLNNIESCGLPFMDRISTWTGAAEHLLVDVPPWHSRAADLFLMAGEAERAAALLEGIHQFKDLGRPDQSIPPEREGLEQRLKMFFDMSVDESQHTRRNAARS